MNRHVVNILWPLLMVFHVAPFALEWDHPWQRSGIQVRSDICKTNSLSVLLSLWPIISFFSLYVIHTTLFYLGLGALRSTYFLQRECGVREEGFAVMWLLVNENAEVRAQDVEVTGEVRVVENSPLPIIKMRFCGVRVWKRDH